jgi:hypothetical protein
MTGTAVVCRRDDRGIQGCLGHDSILRHRLVLLLRRWHHDTVSTESSIFSIEDGVSVVACGRPMLLAGPRMIVRLVAPAGPSGHLPIMLASTTTRRSSEIRSKEFWIELHETDRPDG